jgi:hypothetical protein
MECHDGATVPTDHRTDPTRLPAVARAFEDVRAECCLELGHDCPIIVLEGYRSETYQAYLRSIPRYKAALHSQHCQSRAVDGYCRLLTFEQFAACVKRAASRKDSPIRYIEFRPSMNYIHWDTRPTKTLVEEIIT